MTEDDERFLTVVEIVSLFNIPRRLVMLGFRSGQLAGIPHQGNRPWMARKGDARAYAAWLTASEEQQQKEG